jgi:hypothetical protein
VFEEKYCNSPEPKLSSSVTFGFLIINPLFGIPVGYVADW